MSRKFLVCMYINSFKTILNSNIKLNASNNLYLKPSYSSDVFVKTNKNVAFKGNLTLNEQKNELEKIIDEDPRFNKYSKNMLLKNTTEENIDIVHSLITVDRLDINKNKENNSAKQINQLASLVNKDNNEQIKTLLSERTMGRNRFAMNNIIDIMELKDEKNTEFLDFIIKEKQNSIPRFSDRNIVLLLAMRNDENASQMDGLVREKIKIFPRETKPRFDCAGVKSIINLPKNIDKEVFEILKNSYYDSGDARFKGVQIANILSSSPNINKNSLKKILKEKDPNSFNTSIRFYEDDVIKLLNYENNTDTQRLNELLKPENENDLYCVLKTTSSDYSKYLMKNTSAQTYSKIPNEVLFRLKISKKKYEQQSPEYINKMVKNFDSPAVGSLTKNLENTYLKLYNYPESRIHISERVDSLKAKTQLYLITHKVDDVNSLTKYMNNLDVKTLQNIAPRTKKFTPEQLLDFCNFHSQRKTELTEDNLKYKGNLTHLLESELVSASAMNDLLTRFPNTDNRVGHLPKEWMNDFKKENRKDVANNLFDLFSNFAQSNRFDEEENELADSLKELFNRKTSLSYLGFGEFGQAYEVKPDGLEPFALKVFYNQENSLDHIHGKKIEPQNAMFMNNRTNKFVGMYCGQVADSEDKNSFMLMKYVDKNASEVERPSDITLDNIYTKDFSKESGKNYQGGLIIDNGGIRIRHKELIEDPELNKLTRIITQNILSDKNSELAGFNEPRIELVTKYIKKINNPTKVVKAIDIILEDKFDSMRGTTIKKLYEIKNEQQNK